MYGKALSGSAVISLTLLSTVVAAQVAPAVSRTAGPPTAELIGFRSASLTRAVTSAGVRDLELVLPIGSISGCFNPDPLPDGSILDVQGKPIVAAVVVVDSETRGTELHYPYQLGQFSPGCFQPRPEDEVRVVVGSRGSRVIKPKGVDPASVSWRIVIDVDKMTVVR